MAIASDGTTVTVHVVNLNLRTSLCTYPVRETSPAADFPVENDHLTAVAGSATLSDCLQQLMEHNGALLATAGKLFTDVDAALATKISETL